MIDQAKGDASRFEQLLAEYEKAPGVTRDRLYLETVESVLGNNRKVMIDLDSGNNMMYLPLDKLVQNLPSAPGGNGLSNSDISRLTDEVLNEVRSRQNNTSNTVRREGR